MSDLLQTKFRVGGMDCASCATKIDTAVRRIPGVTDVSVSVTAGTMTVKHDDTSDLDAIPKKLFGLGYKATPIPTKSKPVAAEPVYAHGSDCAHDHQHADSTTTRTMTIITIILVIIMPTMAMDLTRTHRHRTRRPEPCKPAFGLAAWTVHPARQRSTRLSGA